MLRETMSAAVEAFTVHGWQKEEERSLPADSEDVTLVDPAGYRWGIYRKAGVEAFTVYAPMEVTVPGMTVSHLSEMARATAGENGWTDWIEVNR